MSDPTPQQAAYCAYQTPRRAHTDLSSVLQPSTAYIQAAVSSMNRLSVPASVAGLLRASTTIISVISAAVDAPRTARNVHDEVQALHAILRQLDDCIVGRFAEPESMARKSQIYVNDLVVTLAGCVRTVSDLDKELGGVRAAGSGNSNRPQRRRLEGARWAAEDPDIAKILRNLQMLTIALSLLLSVYTWLVLGPHRCVMATPIPRRHPAV